MFPSCLVSRRQWLTWAYAGGTKLPLMPSGKTFRSNDPSTYSDFDSVKDLEQVAYCFTSDDPFFGIDLDDCIVDGKLTFGAKMVMSLFEGKCFAEISPSGEGIKLIGIGKKPEKMRCVYDWEGQKIEVYDHSRFWTITRNVFDNQTEIADCQLELDRLFHLLHKEESKPQLVAVQKIDFAPTDDLLLKRAQGYLQHTPVPVKGEINNTLFKTAGHLRSLTVNGERLSDDQIQDLMWQWCGGCDPDLTPEYLRSRVINSKSCGTPPADKPEEKSVYQPVDMSVIEDWLASQDETVDDETYIESLVPPQGLIRKIFDYYCATAFYKSNLMGMATAMSLVQTLFGRRVQSSNGCRTNDYNVVLAPTGNGKENCERTITRILEAAGGTDLIMAAGVQSGNGLLAALAAQPCSIWIKDEFGVYLEGVFGKKKQPMEAQVGRLLLELYSKSDSRYSGNAHAAGKKHEIIQPHLVLLGLSTQGTLATSIDFGQVESGTMNRISWWVVTERPTVQEDIEIVEVPPDLASVVKSWLDFCPEDDCLPPSPKPFVIPWDKNAKDRWIEHLRAIRIKQDSESSLHAALWSRTAHRTLKFALCSVCSRISGPQEINEHYVPRIDITDVEWAIKLSNWISRSAVEFALTATADFGQKRAESAILDFVGKTNGWVSLRLIQKNRKIQKNELQSAANKLHRDGKIEVTRKSYGQKEQISVRTAK